MFTSALWLILFTVEGNFLSFFPLSFRWLSCDGVCVHTAASAAARSVSAAAGDPAAGPLTVPVPPRPQLTYESVIGRLADIETELDTFTSCQARLPAAAATDKAVRDAASEAEKQLEKFSIELSMRKDIFDKVRAERLGGVRRAAPREHVQPAEIRSEPRMSAPGGV